MDGSRLKWPLAVGRCRCLSIRNPKSEMASFHPHSPIPHSLFPAFRPIVRTLTTFSPRPDFVRTLTTFRPLWGRRPGLPFWHRDLRQFCPLKNPSKTEQNRTKTDQNGHQNRKNRSKNSAFCLTYLNIGRQKRPSQPRNGVQSQKKRAFARFGKCKIDVSVMEQALCKRAARPVPRATSPTRPPKPGGPRP